MSTPAAKLPAGRAAVLYLRRSTDKQDQSIGDQRAHLVRHASEHGFEIVGEYVDDGISGTSVEGRGAFQKLIADAQGRPSFRFILCYDVKRFSRGDVDEVGHYRFLLRKCGVEVVYASEGFGDDLAGDFLRPIRQVMARQESVDLSKVTLRGQLSAVNSGSYLSGVAPYGYDCLYSDSHGTPYQLVRTLQSGERDILTPGGGLVRRLPQGERLASSGQGTLRLVLSLPERVEAVRRIFRMYVEEHLGYRSITYRLNEEGVPSPRRGRWGGETYHGTWGISTVKNILVNETYTGVTVWNRRTQAKFHAVRDGQAKPRERHLSGQSKANPKDDWIRIPNTHEPIISRSTFEAAQKSREGREDPDRASRQLRGRARTSNFLLSGLMVCAECGHKFQGYSQKYRQRTDLPPQARPQTYLCGGYVRKGPSVCPRHSIEKAPFEEFILGRVEARLDQILEGGGQEVLRGYVREELARAEADPRAELDRIEADLRRVKSDADRLLANLTEANREFIDEKLVELKMRRRELEACRDALQRARKAPLDAEAAVEKAMSYLGQFRAVLAQGTVVEQKEFLSGFIEGITLWPSEMRGELRMHDVVESSFKCSGWSKPKLYRRMRRYRIAMDFGRTGGKTKKGAPVSERPSGGGFD